jgi:hypothetical protein
MQHTIRLAALFSVTAVSLACSAADPGSPRGVEFARIAVVDEGNQAAVVAMDDESTELSRALMHRDHDRARFEVELDGDRFAAELDVATGDLVIHGESEGKSVSWMSGTGEPMPALIAERWSDITAAWRSALVGEDGSLRADYLRALNVPADFFTPTTADVPVSNLFYCPPPIEICHYDEVEATEVCFILAAMCPPPPPCGILGCEPCWGLHCEPKCGEFSCDPCIGLWCEPTCSRFDPFCQY